MERYLQAISSFLPFDSDDEENIEYLTYLKNALIENADNGKYQFSILAFHMLFMSFIYKQFWVLKEFDYSKVKRFCDRNNKLCEIYKIYDMSILPEKDSIDFTMNAMGFHVNRRSDVKFFVDIRDNCAHASGFIQYDKRDVENHFNKVMDYIKQIADQTKSTVQNTFKQKIQEFWASESFKRTLSVEHANKIIKELKISPIDVEYIFEIDKQTILSSFGGLSFEISYLVIMSVLQCKYRENCDIYNLAVDDNFLYAQLFLLINSIKPEDFEKIEIELEDELNASEELFSTVPFSILIEGLKTQNAS